MRNFIVSVAILSVWACAINPHTGMPVITMGVEIVWELESVYTYDSEDIAGNLAILLTELGYSLATVSKDPLLIKTEIRNMGDYVHGIQRYRLGIYLAAANRFRLKIEALHVLSAATDTNPSFADGINRWHYDAIMSPLEEVFAERGWKRVKKTVE